MVRDAPQLGSMIDDLLERIVPTLPANDRRAELSVSLQLLRTSLIQGRVVEVSHTLGEARASTDRYAVLDDNEDTAVDLDDLRLALDVVAHHLDDKR
jgi:hypothetical protein